MLRIPARNVGIIDLENTDVNESKNRMRDVALELRMDPGTTFRGAGRDSSGVGLSSVGLWDEFRMRVVHVRVVHGSGPDVFLRRMAGRGVPTGVVVSGRMRPAADPMLACIVASSVERVPLFVRRHGDEFLVPVHPDGDAARVGLATVFREDLDDHAVIGLSEFALGDHDMAVGHVLDTCAALGATPAWRPEDEPFLPVRSIPERTMAFG